MEDYPVSNKINLPLVTYILFAYNQQRYIEDAVRSALNQDYQPLQIILSDDCSTDNTYSLICRLANQYSGPHKLTINRNQENLGLAGHINKIVQKAEGNIIVWAAGDDISLPSKVSLLAGPMLVDESVMGVHSPVIEIDENGTPIKQRYLGYHDRLCDLKFIIETGAAVVSQAHGFRKLVFKFFGPLNPSVTHEGKVLSFRESCLGKIVYIDEPTTKYRIGTGTSTYKGRDVNKLTIDEPIKIAFWRYSALKQIQKDYEEIQHQRPDLEKLILKNTECFKNLYLINKTAWSFKPLFNVLKGGFGTLPALKAFVRRNSPYWVRLGLVNLRSGFR